VQFTELPARFQLKFCTRHPVAALHAGKSFLASNVGGRGRAAISKMPGLEHTKHFDHDSGTALQVSVQENPHGCCSAIEKQDRYSKNLVLNKVIKWASKRNWLFFRLAAPVQCRHAEYHGPAFS